MTLEIPSDGDLSANHCKECTSWAVLTDPVEIRHALLCRNRLHFGQAHGTFPTVPPFNNAVDWTASTPEADDMLRGTLSFAVEIWMKLPPTSYTNLKCPLHSTPFHQR
jgi:hypothetical protein